MADKNKKKRLTVKSASAGKNNMRNFPSVSSILEDSALQPLIESWSFTFVASEVKKLSSSWKKKCVTGGPIPSKSQLIAEIASLFKRYQRQLIQPVINGTGVILHTNLGRAPISSEDYERLIDAVTGYSNLEFDLIEGKRSNRSRMPGRMLAALSGAEAGMAVNNNAAAVYLIGASIAGPGKEVLISRGQLIQIGGGFRIPDIIERSGARLREVGTTNKTGLADYQKAIGKNTALILFVHKSNFIQKGFTEEPEISNIVSLAKSKKVPVCYDLGSGMIHSNDKYRHLEEPTVQSAVRSGVDLVCFSGDKLLGGPQAGLIVGKEKLIAALLKDPLYRTFRLDKLSIGLLEGALLAHLQGTPPPCWQMASLSVDYLKKKAEEVVTSIPSPLVQAVALRSSFGGGSLPEYDFDGYGIKIAGDPVALSHKLLDYYIPVVCRSGPNGVLIDLRTVMPEQITMLTEAIKSCL